MKNQEQTIERIVALVIQRLQASGAAQWQSEAAVSDERPAAQATMVADAVITENTLLAVAAPGSSITVGPRSVLTPSAHDYLRTQNIRWTRDSVEDSSSAGPRRLLIISKEFEDGAAADWQMADGQMADGLAVPCEVQTVPSDAQAAQLAQRQLNNAGGELVVIACAAGARVACLANRDSQVRAAVVDSAADAMRLSRVLGANVLCLEAAGKSRFEFQFLVRSVLKTPVPKQPADWVSQPMACVESSHARR